MSYDPTSLEGVPEDARNRLAQNKAGLFTSDLSVREFLLVKQAGFDPLGPGRGELDLPHRLPAVELEPEPGDGRAHAGDVPRPRARDDAHGGGGRPARRRRHRRRAARRRPVRVGRRPGRVHRHRHGRQAPRRASCTARRTGGRSRATSPARTSGRSSQAGYRPVGHVHGQLRLPRRPPGPARLVLEDRPERRDGELHPGAVRRARAGDGADAGRGPGASRPRASSACRSRSAATAGART